MLFGQILSPKMVQIYIYIYFFCCLPTSSIHECWSKYRIYNIFQRDISMTFFSFDRSLFFLETDYFPISFMYLFVLSVSRSVGLSYDFTWIRPLKTRKQKSSVFERGYSFPDPTHGDVMKFMIQSLINVLIRVCTKPITPSHPYPRTCVVVMLAVQSIFF